MTAPRKPRHSAPPAITPGELAYFMDDKSFDYFAAGERWTDYKLFADRDLGEAVTGYGERRWRLAETDVLAAWVKKSPGTRPSSWWRWSAPEPRRRVGGVGNVNPDYIPEFEFGLPLPVHWLPNSRPRFESQAAYLARHNLFMPGERARLSKADFKAEKITPLLARDDE